MCVAKNRPHNSNVDNVNPDRLRIWDYANAPDSSTDGDSKYVASRTQEQPIFVMGGVSYAQTYNGATAVATSDSIALNKVS